jgi:F-box/WD-40 domain protein MET30
MSQVQCLKLFSLNSGHGAGDVTPDRSSDDSTRLAEATTSALTISGAQTPPREARQSQLFLVSGSLDNTVKLWDIDTGKVVRTLFGHIEGVWAVACNNMRLVSGSHDRTIKIWSRDDGRCVSTLVGHTGAVTCLALGEDKIISGSDDGDVRIWSFCV